MLDAMLVALLSPAQVTDAYRRIYRAGRRQVEPPEVILDAIASHQGTWALADVPLFALDYQGVEDSGPERIARARHYAELGGMFPPGMAKYGPRLQRRHTGKAYVLDGNHRALAAQFRGDRTIQMFIPLDDLRKLQVDAGI